MFLDSLQLKYLDFIPRYVIYAILVFTPFARASTEDWAITIILLLALIAVVSFLISSCLRFEWHWVKTRLDAPIILLIILSIASALFSVHRDSSFWAVSLFTSYMLLFYLTLTFIQFRVYLKNIHYAIIGIAALLSFFGFLKLFGLNPFSFYEYAVSGKGAYRLSSTFVNPDHFSGYVEMCLLLILGTTITGYYKDFLIPMIVTIFLLTVGLIYTFSRGGWISLFAGFAFLLAIFFADQRVNKKKVIIFCGLFLAAFSIILLSSSSLTHRLLTLFDFIYIPNFRDRILAWKGIIDMIQDYPVLGTGPGTFSLMFSQYQPPGTGGAFYLNAHNDYLHFISEVGLWLVPMMVWMAFALFRNGFQKLKNPSRLIRGTTAGAMAGIVSILVHSIVDFNLHNPANAVLFTILTAIVVAPISEHRYPPSKSGHPNKPMHQID